MYSAVTPNLPDATCLTAEFLESCASNGTKRVSSSPPSPVLDRAPMRFIAIASVSCASRLMEPSEIAPVANRGRICSTGSTSLNGIGCIFDSSNSIRFRNARSPAGSLSASASNCL